MKIKIFIIIVFAILILIFFGFQLSLIGNDYIDKGYSEKNILRYPTNSATIDVEFIYLYSSDFFLDYFPDLEDIFTTRLSQSDNSGISIPQFFKKYTNYNWNFNFRKVYRSYSPRIPSWAEDIFGLIGSSYTNGEATQLSAELKETYLNSQSEFYLKKADILVVITDLYFSSNPDLFSAWSFFSPLDFGRVSGHGGGTEDEGMALCKHRISHEFCHLFGAYDHYEFGGNCHNFCTNCIMGDSSEYWGDSLSSTGMPYIDSRILQQEIHWDYLIKDRLYIVPITISGYIRDGFSKIGISDSNVYFNDDYVTSTDNNGYFSFDFDGGDGEFTIKKDGYYDTHGQWGNTYRSWWKDESVTIYMSPKKDNGSGENDTSGFEFLILLLAIFVIIRKKIFKKEDERGKEK